MGGWVGVGKERLGVCMWYYVMCESMHIHCIYEYLRM